MHAYSLNGATGRLHELEPDERALFSAVLSLTQQLDVRQRCAATLAAAEALFDATSTWILLHDAVAQKLEVSVFRGVGADCYRGLVIPDTAGLVGRAFHHSEAVFVPDVREEAGWFDSGRMWRSGLKSVLLVPLVFEGRAVGVLALDSPRFTDARPPAGADLARLEALAALAAIAIANARLFERTEHDRLRLEAALSERQRLRDQVEALRRQQATGSAKAKFIGTSAAIKRVLDEIDVVASADTTVMLLGETGVGKDLAARVIHETSRRAGRPFVPVNCGAMPAALVESELFGYERGAFTGAVTAKPGKFELAHGGTLFLDEVAELPLDAQVKLLRVLQDGRIERVGGTKPLELDVRIVAATNANLSHRLADGTFRADLFYRLSVFPIELPPLRQRRTDVPLLAACFGQQCAVRMGLEFGGFSAGALDALARREWPGNVRELQNVVERAVLLTGGATIGAEALSAFDWTVVAKAEGPAPAADALPYGAPPGEPPSLADAERHAITRALESAGWRVSGPAGAATLLGLKATTLHSKMKKLGIRRPQCWPPVRPQNQDR